MTYILKHPPTPWGVTGRDTIVAGLDTTVGRNLIAECRGISAVNKWANAEFIVLAVNSHAQLVEALRHCVTDEVPVTLSGIPSLTGQRLMEITAIARAALAAAEATP